MPDFFRETITEYFQRADLVEDRCDGLTLRGVSASRTEDLELQLELRLRGFRGDGPDEQPVGSIHRPDATMDFADDYGGTGVARGVHWLRQTSTLAGPDDSQTVERYSAQSLEWDQNSGAEPTYTVEWVLNFPDVGLWPEMERVTRTDTVRRELGSSPSKLVILSDSTGLGVHRVLELRIGSFDVFIARPDKAVDRGRGAAEIIYRGCPDEEFRDRVRDCLSFVLGAPVIYLGHTDFGVDWHPIRMRSVDAYSSEGAYLKHIAVPPYPLHGRYGQLLDRVPIERAVNAIFERYEEMSFRSLAWAYWHAQCAPLHSRAIHFGGLIEQLLRSTAFEVDADQRRLVATGEWGSVEKAALAELAKLKIDSELRQVLKGKIASLNQAPPNIILKRILATKGLEVGASELSAWRHRNAAAHGARRPNAEDVILNCNLLGVLFHRMVAAATGCSDAYVDIYNLGHPVRSIVRPVPARTKAVPLGSSLGAGA